MIYELVHISNEFFEVCVYSMQQGRTPEKISEGGSFKYYICINDSSYSIKLYNVVYFMDIF